MANNLKDHLKEVADAIRAKKGTTELINPQDFSAEIASIEGGGSGGGESNIEYLDVSSLGSAGVVILRFSLEGRVKSEKLGEYIAAPAANAIYITTSDNDAVVEAVGFDFSEKMVAVVNGQKQEAPVSMVFDRIGIDPSTLPRLTKEQFYSLE